MDTVARTRHQHSLALFRSFSVAFADRFLVVCFLFRFSISHHSNANDIWYVWQNPLNKVWNGVEAISERSLKKKRAIGTFVNFLAKNDQKWVKIVSKLTHAFMICATEKINWSVNWKRISTVETTKFQCSIDCDSLLCVAKLTKLTHTTHVTCIKWFWRSIERRQNFSTKTRKSKHDKKEK